MSRTTTARRIALLSSSSLGLAAIVSAASLGVALTPTAAAAQATCVSTPLPTDNISNNVVYPTGTYNPEITCVYVGDDATVSTSGAITVSTAAPGGGVNLSATGTDDVTWVSTAGTVTGGNQTNGPVIEAITDAGEITISTAGVTGSQATITHGIRAQSATGPIDITATGTVSATNSTSGQYAIEALTGGAINITTAAISTARNGIFAQSTGGGDIGITANGNVASGTPAGSTAIEAISNGGDISITAFSTVGSGGNLAANSANRDGVVAETSGAGAVTLDLRNNVLGFGPDGAAVRVTNDDGDVFIQAARDVRGGVSTNSSSAHLGSGMVIDSGGDIVVESSGVIMGAINATGARPAAIVASGQTFTLTLTGDLESGNNGSEPDNIAYFTASLGGYLTGEGIGLSPTGRISGGTPGIGRYTGGHVDLSGVINGATLNFNDRARWVVTDTSLLSPGDDLVSLDATSVLMTEQSGDNEGALFADVDQTVSPPGVIDFGDGEDTVNSLGRLLVGPVSSRQTNLGTGPDKPPSSSARVGVRGEMRLLDLEQFNNSGEIWLGAMLYVGNDVEGSGGESVTALTGTDRFHDDMLYMPGATFHGEEGSIVFMDVDVNKTQTSCAPSTRDADGWLPAADCISLPGGVATGRTELRIFEQIPGDRGIYNPEGIVLVDLAGGDPDAIDPNAFFIGPETNRYADVGLNGGIDKGVFVYALGFDADLQQFSLYGIPSSGSQQFPILATAANQLWRTATEGWFNRRVHQRDVDDDEGLGTGAWFNLSGVGVQRDISTQIALGTGEATFDNSYEQSDVTISFGWDLLDYGSNTALGVMVGYAHSEVEFDDSDNSANLEGIHAGAYGGYGVGGFFIDGAVNLTMLTLDNDVPTMNLQPSGTMLDSKIRSLGAQVEAGWRWDAGYGVAIEPLVGFSAVSTDFEDMRVPNDDPDANRPGVTVSLDSAESRRASAGLRLSMQDLWTHVAPTSFSLTARAVNEFEGGANVSVANVGPTYLSTDTLDGMFTQLTGSVGVSNVARTISGYLNVDAVTGDDYESLGASLGVRLHW